MKLRIHNIFFFCICLIAAVEFAGCAGLPRASKVLAETPAESPQILAAKGFLTPEQSKALIERLEKQSGQAGDLLSRQVAVMESVSGSPLVKGNKVSLLINTPATYAAMYKAVGEARDNINIETFIIQDDEFGDKFADLLIRKRSEGVQVNLIYDSVGSGGTPKAFFDRLRRGGVHVLEFNPVNPLKARGRWRVIHRDHRKLLIVDGKVVITGGVNIVEFYSGRPSGSKRMEKGQSVHWRDTDVYIEGPVVAGFQKIFLQTWRSQHGPELPPRKYFPELKESGDDLVQVIDNTQGKQNRMTFIMYVSAVTFAEKSIHLTNAYFVPDGQMVKALTGAARRGVDVEIVLPGVSDSALAFYAGRYYYSDLLESGVKLFERRNALLHAKTGSIDGVWSTVGSTNMDFWSFLNNDEVNAVVLSRHFAGQMERMFSGDLRESDRVRLEDWKKRPLLPRFREWIAHLFAHLL
jgi:cardiolipin synthase